MAYALKFLEASSQYVELANPLDFLSDTNWTVEFRANIPTGSLFTVLGADSFNTGLVFYGDPAFRIRANGGGTQEILYHYNITGLGWTTYKIEKIADTVKLYLNDVEVASTTSANVAGWTQSHPLKYVSRTVSNYSDGDISWLKVNGTTINLNLDATSSTHTGAVQLDDISGNNNHATGYNFPTDGTAWEDLDPAPEKLTIDNQNYSFKKKSGSSATHTITGAYLDDPTPTAIEYQLDGGAWQVADASPTGNAYSFDVVIPVGESTVNVRFANDVAVTASVILVTPALVVACALMQSNGSGRGENNQTYTQAGGVKAYLFGNDDNYKLLEDPYDSNVDQVDSVSSDLNPGGSWIVRFAHYWIESQGTPIAFVPCAKGGTSILAWEETDPLYISMARRINAVGGVDVVFSQIGETDSDGNTTATQYETAYNTIANSIKTNFDADTFIIPLHTITAGGYEGDGVTTGQNAIRQAQINIAQSNPNVSIGQPLTDIDISGNDGLHFWTDTELDTIASRMYASYAGNVSDLIISVSGTPDGTYNTVIVNASNEIVFSGNLVFTGGVSTITSLPLIAGTPLTGFVIDNEITHANGAVIKGTTV